MSENELAARLYESVADDEQLRGSLSDSAYAPVLQWAGTLAEELGSSADDSRLDDLQASLRAAVGALAAAIETGDTSSLTEIDPQLVGTDLRTALANAVQASIPEAEARAQAVAEVLQEAHS